MFRSKRVAAGATGLLATAAIAGTLVAAGVANADASSAGHRPPLGTRADVPWSKVGPGWSLATWSGRTGGKAVLFLVTPSGGRYTITSGLPAYTEPQLFGSRGDNAVLDTGSGAEQIDLRTGHTHGITTAGDAPIAHAGTSPSQHDLIMTRYSQGRAHLERTDAVGRPVAAYPSTVAGAGTINTTRVLTDAAGTRLVAGAAHGLVLFDDKGTALRRLHPVSQSCSVSSWWTKDAVVADCAGSLWDVPLSGKPATKLASASTAPIAGLGYADIWRTSAGRVGLAESGCGPRPLVRFDAKGVGRYASVPSPTGRPGTNTVVGHRGDTVYLTHRSVSGCVSGTNTFFGWNAKTGPELAYLGAPVTSGTVVGALPYPTS
ncbi:hypothetical protein [Jatrophihabitans fulvus]